MRKVKLGDLVEVLNEREDRPSESKYERFVGLEHYDSGEVVISRWGSTEKLDSAMKIFHKGNILVARRNVYLKRAAVVDFDGLTSGDSIVLHVKYPKYESIIPFVLNTDSFWDFADKHSDGSMSKRLSPKKMLEFEFLLPDDSECTKISEVLWAMHRHRMSYQRLILVTDDLAKARFVEMFGDPLLNSHDLSLIKLQELGVWKSGGTPSRSKTDYFNGTIDWFSAGELNSIFIDHSIEKITEEAVENSSTSIFPAGSMFIGMYDTAAFKMSILKNDAAANQACANIIPNQQVEILWLYMVLQIMKPYFLEQRRGCRQKNLNLGMIKGFEIPFPQKEEQTEFVRFFEKILESKRSAEQALEDLTNTQKALMHKYLEEENIA